MTAEDHLAPHALAEEERRIRSFQYAEAIRDDPYLLLRASELIASVVNSGEATIGQELWSRILREPVEFVICCMTADDAEGRLLRSNNPFSFLVGQTSTADRRQTRLEAANRLSCR
jgi:hypothetical protein